MLLPAGKITGLRGQAVRPSLLFRICSPTQGCATLPGSPGMLSRHQLPVFSPLTIKGSGHLPTTVCPSSSCCSGLCQRQLCAQGAPPRAAAPHRHCRQGAVAHLHPLHLQEPVQVSGAVGLVVCSATQCARRWLFGAGQTCQAGGCACCTAPQRSHFLNRLLYSQSLSKCTNQACLCLRLCTSPAGSTAAPSWTLYWRAATSGCKSCCRSWAAPSEMDARLMPTHSLAAARGAGPRLFEAGASGACRPANSCGRCPAAGPAFCARADLHLGSQKTVLPYFPISALPVNTTTRGPRGPHMYPNTAVGMQPSPCSGHDHAAATVTLDRHALYAVLAYQEAALDGESATIRVQVYTGTITCALRAGGWGGGKEGLV